jgi:hypothetical protein
VAAGLHRDAQLQLGYRARYIAEAGIQVDPNI